MHTLVAGLPSVERWVQPIMARARKSNAESQVDKGWAQLEKMVQGRVENAVRR